MEIDTQFFDLNRIPVFVCIGSTKHDLDSIAPKIGSKLKNLGYLVLGTEKKPINAKNLEEINNRYIKLFNPKIFQIIAIDACISSMMKVIKAPLKPGFGVGKLLPEIGELSILIGISDLLNGEPIMSKRKAARVDKDKLLVRRDIVVNLIEMIYNNSTKPCMKLRIASKVLVDKKSTRCIAEELRVSRESVRTITGYYEKRNIDLSDAIAETFKANQLRSKTYSEIFFKEIREEQ